jgi:biopolymer transport protein ExbB/TolQ
MTIVRMIGMRTDTKGVVGMMMMMMMMMMVMVMVMMMMMMMMMMMSVGIVVEAFWFPINHASLRSPCGQVWDEAGEDKSSQDLAMDKRMKIEARMKLLQEEEGKPKDDKDDDDDEKK